MSHRPGLAWAGTTVLVGLAVATFDIFGSARSAPRAEKAEESKGRFHARLLEIARDYASFGRVDDEYRWAPYLCRKPTPASARFSASKETKTHGQKLYSLFAKNPTGYLARKDQAVGQVLVKQSWVPKEIPDDGKPRFPEIRRVKETAQVQGRKPVTIEHYDSFLPYARKDGKLFRADKQADLSQALLNNNVYFRS
jgi:hypothetical protein